MTKECFLFVLLLSVSVFAQESNNENVNDVESIAQGPNLLAQAPAQANEQPGNEFSPNDLNYGKNICIFLEL